MTLNCTHVQKQIEVHVIECVGPRVYWVILVAWWNDDVVADAVADDAVADVVVVEADELVKEEPFSDTEKAETWEARWQ